MSRRKMCRCTTAAPFFVEPYAQTLSGKIVDFPRRTFCCDAHAHFPVTLSIPGQEGIPGSNAEMFWPPIVATWMNIWR